MKPRFFGYGSLVNGRTHDYPDLTPARLSGWARGWRQAPGRRVSLLTVWEENDVEIDGATALVPGADWAALDLREAAYARRDVTRQIAPAPVGPVSVYAVPDPSGRTDPPPILLSYLDTVLAGFAALHGPDGPLRFMDETAGWEAPIADDRADPIYPRHRPGDAALIAWTDARLAEMGVRRAAPTESWP